MTKVTFAVLAGLLFATTASFAQGAMMPAGVKAADGRLTDSKGMTLYTFDNDKEAGKSACNGPCLAAWPALAAPADAKVMGEWMPISRDDGSKQWAYKGKPLYTFARDEKAGDVSGNGKGNVWHTAAP